MIAMDTTLGFGIILDTYECVKDYKTAFTITGEPLIIDYFEGDFKWNFKYRTIKTYQTLYGLLWSNWAMYSLMYTASRDKDRSFNWIPTIEGLIVSIMNAILTFIEPI